MIKYPTSILLENSQSIIQSFKPKLHVHVSSLDTGTPGDAIWYPLPNSPYLPVLVNGQVVTSDLWIILDVDMLMSSFST